MSFSSSHQTIYGVQLLDELHNYFPDVLYGAPGRFSNVDDLLGYIRDRVRQRFDLYSYGRALAMPLVADGGSAPSPHAPGGSGATNAPPASGAASSSSAASTTPPPANNNSTPNAPIRRQQVQRISRQGPLSTATILTSQSGLNSINPMSLFGTALSFEENDLFENLMGTDPLVTNLLSQFINPITRPPSNFAAPVVVRPTAAQIEAASEITTLQGESDDVCTICQDGYVANVSVRRLNACGHRFHQACIDPWFATNVRCPVCRHDIREPAAEANANQNANQNTNHVESDGE